MLAAHWPPRLSGHGDYARHLATTLHAQGMCCSVLVLGQADVSSGDPFAVETGPFPDSWHALSRIRTMVARHRPDVVLIQFEAHAFRLEAIPHLLSLVLRAGGHRTVVMYHELWAPRRLGRLSKLLLLNAAHRVVVFSAWHAAGVARFRRIGPAADIIPVPPNIPGSSVGDRRLIRLRFGFAAGDLVITFFGFVIEEHAVHELLHAIALVRGAFPTVRLSVIGAFDPIRNGYHQRLMRDVREHQLDSFVTWHGRVDAQVDVARVIAISDIGVLPYVSGVGENNGAFAAFAGLGVATITTRGERSAEMEREGIAEFVAPEAAAIAAAIVRLAADRGRMAALSERILSWSHRRSWDQVGSAFRRVLAVGGAGAAVS